MIDFLRFVTRVILFLLLSTILGGTTVFALVLFVSAISKTAGSNPPRPCGEFSVESYEQKEVPARCEHYQVPSSDPEATSSGEQNNKVED